MRSLNKVELIGRLGADPEIRYTQAADAVATLSIATSDQWKDKATGEPREETEWHRCVLWRRLADIAGQYLQKGSRVYIAGNLKTRKWQDSNGQDRYTTEIQVRDMIMLDGQGGQSTPQHQRQQAAPPQPQHRGNGQRPPINTASFQQQAPDYDDDIPF